MGFPMDGSAPNTTGSVPAIGGNIREGPDWRAHAPAYGEAPPRIRPTATAVPTPVARIPVGYTCAASAYIVVWTALIRPPVHASIASTPAADCAATSWL